MMIKYFQGFHHKFGSELAIRQIVDKTDYLVSELFMSVHDVYFQ